MAAFETETSTPTLFFVTDDEEFNPSIFLQCFGAGCEIDGLGFAITFGAEARAGDAFFDEITAHRGGAALGELEVVFGLADAIGVALDPHDELGVVDHDLHHIIEDREARRQNFVVVMGKEDALVDLNLVFQAHHQEVGAAVFVVVAVKIFGLVRAFIGAVGDEVEVVVILGATVGVLVAIGVFGDQGAVVETIGDFVAVVVGIGAAVLVEVAIVVLGLVGTLVAVVGDAVLVRIGFEVGAAVGVELVVDVFWQGWAEVDAVHDAVAVAVAILGAAVFVLVTVQVLSGIGAVVHRVGDAVFILIFEGIGGRGQGEAEREEDRREVFHVSGQCL